MVLLLLHLLSEVNWLKSFPRNIFLLTVLQVRYVTHHKYYIFKQITQAYDIISSMSTIIQALSHISI